MSPPKCSGDGVHASSSTTTAFILLICLSILPNPITSSSDIGFTSVVISEKGLDFAKDILIQLGVNSLTPLELPEITKSINIPLIGGVEMSLKDIVITSVNVGESEIEVGESGIVVGATGGNAKLGMDWRYSYSTWLIIPIEVSDQGSATVETKGMEIELKMTMKNQDGNLKLTLLHCVCNMKELFVTLDGGTSWLYQGLIDAFEDQIRTAVEKAITQKIVEGIKSLDSMLQKIPKEVKVDDVVSLNVTFMDDPLFGNSFIEFDIDGLFVPSNFIEANRVPEKLLKDTSSSRVPCQRLEMLGISLDQAVFNTASALYFQAGLMHLTVDNVPDQPLMNTAGWRFIIPKLYKKYPNDDMALNISLTSPPEIIITSEAIATTLYSDLTVDVLDSGVLIPVACISVTISASGVMEISGNNLTGQAKLESFSLDLKWSNVGNFYMSLIEKAIWTFLNNFFIPQVNRHLEKGFPLPIISGFSLENSIISLSDSTISVCSDVNYKEVGSPSTITNFKPKRLDKN